MKLRGASIPCFALLAVAALAALAGCANQHQQQEKIAGAVSNFYAGNYPVAMTTLKPLAEKPNEDFVLNNLRLGSAALDLCYVAAGRFDGYWESKIQPWDVAAGALIVEEAGGRTLPFMPQPVTAKAMCVAAAPGVFAELVELVG